MSSDLFPGAAVIEGAAVQRLLHAGRDLGEAAVWLPRLRAYMHVDITRPAAFLHNADTGDVREYPLPRSVGTIVPRKAGDSAVVALTDGLYDLSLDSGALTPLAVPPDDEPAGTRFNDGKAAPDGHLLVGTMDLAEAAPIGSLYVLRRDAARTEGRGSSDSGCKAVLHRAVAGVTISNGLAWSADGRTMYYIDSSTQGVDAFDYNDGALSNRRRVATLPTSAGIPDGCCMDAGGRLWVALWGGGAVVCLDVARGGAAVAVVRLPTRLVTTCAFGGAGLRDLYITTARRGEKDEHAGDVFIVRDIAGMTGVAGAPSYEYG